MMFGVGAGDGVAGVGAVVGTLRSGAASGGGAGDVVVGAGSGLTMLVRISDRDSMAVFRGAGRGEIGARGLGRRRALAMSRREARMRSLLEFCGMLTEVGNHATVSHVRVARVSWIQTR